MSNIPEDIKQKIDEQAKIVCTTALFAGTLIIDNFKQSVFAGGGQYGYSLALPKIEELEKKIEKLEYQIKYAEPNVIFSPDDKLRELLKEIEELEKEVADQHTKQKELVKEIEFLKKCISDLNYFKA